MKTPLQKSALAIALLLLTACAGGPGGSSISLGIGGFGSHIGLGTSVNIPIGSRIPDADKGGINVTEEQIITHFTADGTASEQAVKGGSYRRLLNVLGGGNYLVQDFYGDGQKRTDPMILPQKALFSADAHPADSAYTVYDRNGPDTPTGLPQQPAYRQLTAIPAKPEERPSEIMFQTAFLYRFKQRQIRICF